MNFTEEPKMSASSLPLPQARASRSNNLSVAILMRSVCWGDRHSLSGLLPERAWLYLIDNQMNVLRDAATIGIAAWAMS